MSQQMKKSKENKSMMNMSEEPYVLQMFQRSDSWIW
jgi:hypothetical protein